MLNFFSLTVIVGLKLPKKQHTVTVIVIVAIKTSSLMTLIAALIARNRCHAILLSSNGKSHLVRLMCLRMSQLDRKKGKSSS